MIFGTWDVRSLYREVTLKSEANELANHELHVMAVK